MLALIPARGGSKSIPRKNIVPIQGHPLIAYTIAACQLSHQITRIIVSTEDTEIAEIATRYGAEVPFLRPSEHSTDQSSDLGFLTHFFEVIGADEVALMRPVTPLRDPRSIDTIISTWASISASSTSLRSVHEVREPPYKLFKLDASNQLCGFFTDFEGNADYSALPRQVFPTTFRGNGYVDIVKSSTVSEGSCFGTRVHAFVTEEVIDIDTPTDMSFLEFQLQTNSHLLLDYLNQNPEAALL